MPDGSAKVTKDAVGQVADVSNLPHAKILTALNNVMAKVGYVQKQGENKFHGYKYAGEGNLLEVLRPAMVEEGLLLIPSHAEKSEIDQHGNVTVLVEYTLAHKEGDIWPEKIRVYGSGNDRAKSGAVGDKGIYKAATGANKYLLFKLFQIETGDDPEKESEHDKDAPPVVKPAETKPARGGQMAGPLGVTELKNQLRPFLEKLAATVKEKDAAKLNKLLMDHNAIIEQCERDLPAWYNTKEGTDVLGLQDRIADALDICNPIPHAAE